MTIKIVPFSNKYLTDMAKLYSQVYTQPNLKVTINSGKNVIGLTFKTSPEYNLVALYNNKCVGGVFGCLDHSFLNKYLYVYSVQVKPKYQKQGVGTKLLEHLLAVARSTGVKRVGMMVDSKGDYQGRWYRKSGFNPTGWVGYEIGLTRKGRKHG